MTHSDERTDHHLVDDAKPATRPTLVDTHDALRAERRAALAKLGKLAGYTVPVMLSLLVPYRNWAAFS